MQPGPDRGTERKLRESLTKRFNQKSTARGPDSFLFNATIARVAVTRLLEGDRDDVPDYCIVALLALAWQEVERRELQAVLAGIDPTDDAARGLYW